MLSSTGTKQKPALDESSFQQLLAAAYTVQRHNESLSPNNSSGTSQVLAAIAEIQSEIRTRRLNVAESAALIARRILTLTSAIGVSISLVDNGFLDCVAEAGVPAKIPGSTLTSHSLVATERLKSGQIFESENSQTDLRLDLELCRQTGVGSLVAAPVLRFGEIAGLVEVRWSHAKGFSESDVRTFRLMAALITGTLERSIRIGGADPAATHEERAAQTAVETALAEPESGGAPSTETELVLAEVQPIAAPELAAPLVESDPSSQTSPTPPSLNEPLPISACRMCGRPFAGDEQFCGFCSMPRPMENRSQELQSKWASLWFMQRAQGVMQEAETHPRDTSENQVRIWHDAQLAAPEPLPEVEPLPPKPVMWPRRAPEEQTAEPVELAVPEAVEESVGHESFPFDDRPSFSERSRAFARLHWRDGILASVVITLAYGAFTAWPRSSNQPTWFQSLMVRTGVMQPHTKVFAGAPDARVWIDVHTQLYYCSGEDLYGKTPDGEFTTQYNAQSDGFLPAFNTTCP
jgi:hypothetical protein